MSRIQLLSENVASQVAAGEVIERPASVVKELVENSIDAGAKKIEVMIRRGGISSIRVVDDGCGMDRDDALLCLERHATSKIRTGHDLAAISTLGFRGEAIPSIASVSRFSLTTREHGAIAGTEIAVNGGKIDFVRDGGDAPGTQIEARSLFYNLPARRKFLRTENTESSHVEHQMHLQAIGHPQIGFVLVNDERLIYQLPAVTNLIDRVRDLSGVALAGELLEIQANPAGGISIGGLVGKPGVSRSTRAQQIVFVNGRAVENSTINYALREGYHTALMKGQHPVTFLFIEMDPAAVDVNVHPAKREVRFRDPSLLREAIVESVRRTIETGRGEWRKTFVPPSSAPAAVPESAVGSSAGENRKPPIPDTLPLIEPREQVTLRRDWSSLPVENFKSPATDALQRTRSDGQAFNQRPGFQISNLKNLESSAPAGNAPPAAAPAQSSTQESKLKNFKILGVLGKLYVLMENESGLVLVDQHAAHERILFEELRRRMEDQGVPGQRLLMPLTIQVGPRDGDWIGQNLGTLHKMGIGIEPFGAGTFKIDALPQFMQTGEPLQLVREIIDELRQTSATTSKMRLGEDVIASAACRHAVKANDYLREPELVELIKNLLACELPYCCPHGRPTMIQISYLELEKKFGRKV
jgi:DNA mismatch repair protein MutL